MSDTHEARCRILGLGFIGYFSGIMWSESKSTDWRRLISFVSGSVRFILGNVSSTPWIRTQAAWRYRDCKTLVVPATLA